MDTLPRLYRWLRRSRLGRTLRTSFRALRVFGSRVASRPDFLPITFGVGVGLVIAWLLVSLTGMSGGLRAVVFGLYGAGMPSCVLLALRRQPMARGLALSLMWCALAMFGTALAFNLVKVGHGQIRDSGVTYMGLLAFFASAVRNLQGPANPPADPDE